MIVTKILLTILLTMVALAIGFEYGVRVGDNRGIVGVVFGALVFATGLSWALGW